MSNYRICLLGNSHLAAAKLGWDQVANRFPDFDLDFFGFAPGTSARFEAHLEVVDRSLVAATPKIQRGFRLTAGGRTRIQGADYSAFVTFGLGFSGPSFAARSICANHRLFDYAESDTYVISRACLTATIEDVLQSERMALPFKTLRAISDAPVFLHSIPGPTLRIMGDPSHANDPCSIPGLLGAVRSVFDEQCREAGQPDLYTYIPQPHETIDDSGLTKDEFIANGVGFGAFRGRSKLTNVGHGNASYGAMVMEKLLSVLQNSPNLQPR